MSTPGSLDTQWFDGRSPRARPASLRIEGGELLLGADDGQQRRYPVKAVRWPERTTHGQRQAELPDGGLVQHADAAEWDAWWRASGLHESAVVGWMQSWRASLVAMAGSVAFFAAAWVWGVPWLSQALTHLVPASVEVAIGKQSLEQLDGLFLAPSRLPLARQDALRQRFASVVERAYPEGDAPAWQLSFHKSEILGANAFALPGGAIVMTDELVELLADQPDAIVGVLAHELGHVQHRHGLDLMVRASLVSALVGVVHRSGIPPAVMAVFFERLRKEEGLDTPADKPGPRPGPKDPARDEEGVEADDEGGLLPIAISSHPDHAARIRFFREWQASAP